MSISENQMSVFSFENNAVRLQMLNNEPWFCLSDVCKVLDIGNPSQLKTRLSEKGVITNDTLTSGGIQTMTFISEQNLYKVIFQSRKPEAEKFSDWVTGEVLPSIRKHGGYLTPAKIEEALLNPDVIIKLATDLKEERTKRLEAERTKAMIGSHREATAMATAANAVKKLKKLENDIGIGATWKRVTCIPWLKKYFNLDNTACSMIGKTLTALSASMDKEVKTVPDERYNQVKAYHVAVIDAFHAMIRNDVNAEILTRYRKIAA